MPDLSAEAAGLNGLAVYVLVGAGLLLLLGIVLWLARRSNGGEIARKAAPARRLAVIDQIALDEKRRLVLIQRDGIEHLVILGGANELLVESGIGEARGSRFNERELRAPAREVPELPAFPAAPAREIPPLPAPSVELAGRQPVLSGPTPPAFSEPLPPRRPAAAEAPAPARPAAPARSEPVRPQPAPPQPAPPARRAEPVSPVAQAVPVPPPAPIIPPAPQPALRAEPEPVRTVEAALAALSPAMERAPATIESETPAPTAEPTKAGGLLSRLRRARQNEVQPQAAVAPEPALAAPSNSEPAIGEPRLAAIDRPDVLPEMPAHSVPEVMLDPPSFEPEPQGATPSAAARVEPDMSKLFDMIVPEQPAAPAAPIPAAPAPARTAAPAVPTPAAPAPAAPTPAVPAPAASTPATPMPEREVPPLDVPAETPRTAVKIDPFFANMAQRLEETLRRPIPPPAPTAPSTPPAKPVTNATEIERVIDRALSAPDEPGKATPASTPVANPPAPNAPAPRAPEVAPQVAPPTQDELEAEMANLLGRGAHR